MKIIFKINYTSLNGDVMTLIEIENQAYLQVHLERLGNLPFRLENAINKNILSDEELIVVNSFKTISNKRIDAIIKQKNDNKIKVKVIKKRLDEQEKSLMRIMQNVL